MKSALISLVVKKGQRCPVSGTNKPLSHCCRAQCRCCSVRSYSSAIAFTSYWHRACSVRNGEMRTFLRSLLGTCAHPFMHGVPSRFQGVCWNFSKASYGHLLFCVLLLGSVLSVDSISSLIRTFQIYRTKLRGQL